ANGQSLSSKEHRMIYGRTQGKKPDMVVCRIIEKGEHEESCFIEAKHFSITRNSNNGGYNLYKVAILCQGGINKIISSRGTETGTKTFGAHVCEGYLILFMMDLEYDGIYRFFQLCEIKLAQELSEFNLVRRLIVETHFFKRRIDYYYSNRNSQNRSPGSPLRNNFSRNPVTTPQAPKADQITEFY
ncbi:7138_t:CDS:2, partial [Paraglomus occultum]